VALVGAFEPGAATGLPSSTVSRFVRP
jgi:hypothetical protein